jgi:cob(I)alamin adenosyltransferase
MGHRLSKIYTRTGDQGTTTLGDGSRVSKDCLRVEAYGEVDEVNCLLGVILSFDVPPQVRNCLTRIQHELFDLGGELSIPTHQLIAQKHVDTLENELDAFNFDLPSLKEFILPGGGKAASHCHQARAVCRRAERRVVSLAQQETVYPSAIAYLNRLSDLLFVLARVLSRHEGNQEVLWHSPRARK